MRHRGRLRELRDSESRGDEAIPFLQTSNFDFKETLINSIKINLENAESLEFAESLLLRV
jgi:hypothetical protein